MPNKPIAALEAAIAQRTRPGISRYLYARITTGGPQNAKRTGLRTVSAYDHDCTTTSWKAVVLDLSRSKFLVVSEEEELEQCVFC